MHGLTEIGPVMITRFRFAAAAVVLLLLMAGRADAQGPGLGAVGGYAALNNYTALGGTLTVFALPSR